MFSKTEQGIALAIEFGIYGGAMYATFGSGITFEESSNITFTDNSATLGGAIFIEDSNLTMYGRVLFERNTACYYGGAITIFDYRGRQNDIMINCSGRSITFRNYTGRYGGAIYASSSAESLNVELKDILFERNTAVIDGGAVYVGGSSINMTGTLNFIQNSAQRGGAMAFDGYYSNN